MKLLLFCPFNREGSIDLSNVPQANGQARAHGEDGLFQDDTKFREKLGRTKIIDGDTVEIKTRLDLSGADLSGASLQNTNMKQANLTNTDMTLIDLSATDLTGADMMGAKLHQVDASSNVGVNTRQLC